MQSEQHITHNFTPLLIRINRLLKPLVSFIRHQCDIKCDRKSGIQQNRHSFDGSLILSMY